MGPVPLYVVFAACSISIGLIAVLAPLVDALRRMVIRIAEGVRRVPRTRAAFALSSDPLDPTLPHAHRRLAQDTRSVLASLEHADLHASRWSDAPARRGWVHRLLSRSHDAYAPTIGMTGEVWRWLQQAEALADDDGPWAQTLATATAAVRGALLSKRPLVVRLDAISHLLVRVDSDLRIRSGTPYRDAVAPVRPIGFGATDRADGGCVEWYEAVLKRYRRPLGQIAARYCATEAEAEDLLQDIHLAIWNALPGFRGDCSERTFVLRIARNRGANARRRRSTIAVMGVCDPTDPTPSADERIDDTRRKTALSRAVNALPRVLREAVTLRLDGLSYREIGARLGVTETNASVRVTRARQALKRGLTSDPA